MNGAVLSVFIDDSYRADSSCLDDKIDRELELSYRNSFERFRFGEERAQDFAPCGIPMCMKDSITAVGAFTSEGVTSRPATSGVPVARV